MSKQSKKDQRTLTQRLRSTPVLFALSVIIVATTLTHGFNVFAVSCNTAASCEQQIANQNSQLSNSEQTLSQLASQAGTYQQAIGQLQSQISGLQSQIQTNQAEQASLQVQITQAQTQLTQQKAVLADDLKTLYVSGQITPIEMLATSSSISQYVDQQVAYTAVQNKIQTTVQQIAALQSKLQTEKTQVDNLIGTLQTQQTQLNAAEAQQASLLSYNESQQAQYNQQIAATNSNISQLRANLSALNDAGSSVFDQSSPCGGGYPTKAASSTSPGTYWGCSEPQDNTTDNWDMDNRECVSYTALMVSARYGISTAGWGNAYQWITAAEAHGYLVNQTPSVGAVAIRGRDYSEAGDVGHAMYVVGVNGSDSITVDEFNEHYNGEFDERTFDPSSYDSRGGIYYIHFQ